MNQLELFDYRINNRLIWITLVALMASQWQTKHAVYNIMESAYRALVTSVVVYDEIHRPDPAVSDDNPVLEA